MGMLAFLDATTPYAYIITAFVIMGLGMGATMMPVFTAALASLKDHDIARGSTLMNITQQVSASIGTALFSVLLTNAYNQHAVVNTTLAIQSAGGDQAKLHAILEQLQPDRSAGQSGGRARPALHGPRVRRRLPGRAVLVGLCLIPAFFLPRRPAEKPADAAAMMVG